MLLYFFGSVKCALVLNEDQCVSKYIKVMENHKVIIPLILLTNTKPVNRENLVLVQKSSVLISYMQYFFKYVKVCCYSTSHHLLIHFTLSSCLTSAVASVLCKIHLTMEDHSLLTQEKLFKLNFDYMYSLCFKDF